VPIARRTFRAGTRLFAAFDIIGARPGAAAGAPRVSLEYRLRRPDGTPIAGGGPQPLRPNAAGQVSAVIGITLPPDASGAHELVLTIRDETAGQTIEDREPLVIEP
jgi:hypothetical protein